MIRKITRKNKIAQKNMFVEPDEIFLDSKNFQNFDNQQFEGRLEKPITKNTVLVLGGFFLLCVLVFGVRLGILQIQKGEAYLKRSENNTLDKVVLFADRGIIYDRNKVELAWNKKVDSSTLSEEETLANSSTSETKNNFPTREYLAPSFAHILGYVSAPAKDKSGNFWQTEYVGKDGLEKMYGDRIKGENGSKLVEVDAQGTIHSENIVNAPKRGADLVTTLDARVQKQLFAVIKDLAEHSGYVGGAGVIMDIRNGEIIASTSYPEYDSGVLSEGIEQEKIKGYLSDKRKVFLDRTISGLYTPGSIVKPFLALGALNEGIISPDKQILSTGSLSLPNPYDKDKPTIFKDWKAHGWTDMREAIAVSSDVYFYTIGGGFEGQKGLGILKIGEYAKKFGIGEKTGVDLPDEKSGVVPSPEWKAQNFKGDAWRVGDTYHTSIGQYGFQVTPLEMVRATGALANGGTLVTPHFILGDTEKENQKTILTFRADDLRVVQEGMRMTVTQGTATALNVPYVKVAAKTGTAQVGLLKNKVNAWVIGYFPYENPKYAFVMMMESGPATGASGASPFFRQLLDWMSLNTPEYFE